MHAWDLDTLRIWLFEKGELPRFAQQRTAGKYHLYMYTDKVVALRGRKSMKFDYEFESYRLENRAHREIFEKRTARRVAKRGPAKKRAGRRRVVKKARRVKRAVKKGAVRKTAKAVTRKR